MTWNFSSGDMAATCVFVSLSSFNRWYFHPPNGLWCNGVFRVLWTSRFKFAVRSSCSFLRLFSLPNLPRAFFPWRLWNTCICNHSCQEIINLKISYSTMFYAYFLFMPFLVCLRGTKGASGCMGALWKAKGERLHGFRMRSCTQEWETVKVGCMSQV